MAAPKGGAFMLDDALYKKKIRDLARLNGIDEGEFVQEQGSFYARDMARRAPPYVQFPTGRGTSIGTAKDKKQGELAIYNDLLAIFRVKDQSFITFCQKNFGTGTVSKEMRGKGGKTYRIEYNRICMTLQEMDAWHKLQRSRSGRVMKKRNSIESAWCSEALFKKYFNVEKKKVGMAKSALAKAAIQLNAKIKAPAWVKRHLGTADGRGYVIKKKGSPTAVIHAAAAGLQHVLRTDIMRAVTNGRMKAMETNLKMRFKRAAKKAGFKVKG